MSKEVSKICFNGEQYIISDEIAREMIEVLKNTKTNKDELNQERIQSNYNTYGMREKGVGMSAIINDGYKRPGVMDIASGSGLASYPNRDAVGLHVRAYPSIPILNYNQGDTVFTTNTVQCPSLTEEQLEKLKENDLNDTIIDTYDTGIRYSGILQSFDSETKTFTIKDGWYNTKTGENTTPTNGTGIYVGLCTKLWGQNTVVILPENNYCNAAAGYELEVRNYKKNGTDIGLLDLLATTGEDCPFNYGLRFKGKINELIKFDNNIKNGLLMGALEGGKYIVKCDNTDGVPMYFAKANGYQSALRYEQQIITTANTEVNIAKPYVVTQFSSDTNINIARPSDYIGRFYFFQTMGGGTAILNYTNGAGVPATLSIPSGTKKFIFSDGFSWNLVG